VDFIIALEFWGQMVRSWFMQHETCTQGTTLVTDGGGCAWVGRGQVAEDPEAPDKGIKVMADNDIPPIPIGLLCTCRRRRAAAGAPPRLQPLCIGSGHCHGPFAQGTIH
jgi:hypothetical protein